VIPSRLRRAGPDPQSQYPRPEASTVCQHPAGFEATTGWPPRSLGVSLSRSPHPLRSSGASARPASPETVESGFAATVKAAVPSTPSRSPHRPGVTGHRGPSSARGAAGERGRGRLGEGPERTEETPSRSRDYIPRQRRGRLARVAGDRQDWLGGDDGGRGQSLVAAIIPNASCARRSRRTDARKMRRDGWCQGNQNRSHTSGSPVRARTPRDDPLVGRPLARASHDRRPDRPGGSGTGESTRWSPIVPGPCRPRRGRAMAPPRVT
jgi:hypothetical protein